MSLVQVKNNQVVKHGLPTVGTLLDGSTVSGYHLLSENTLRREGWLPLEDIEPEYNKDTHYLVDDGYEILPDKVIRKYTLEKLPLHIDEPKVTLDERITALEEALIELL